MRLVLFHVELEAPDEHVPDRVDDPQAGMIGEYLEQYRERIEAARYILPADWTATITADWAAAPEPVREECVCAACGASFDADEPYGILRGQEYCLACYRELTGYPEPDRDARRLIKLEEAEAVDRCTPN